MSCSQARRELLEHFALGEELGSRAGPHLAHLESCLDCRRAVGIDRQLVENLRRALRERVAGSAPSEASWGRVRSRTVDRPGRPWTVRMMRWGGMLSAAAAAGIMTIVVATAPDPGLSSGTISQFAASAAKRVPPLEEAGGLLPGYSSTQVLPRTSGPLPGWPMQTQMSDATTAGDSDQPMSRRVP